MKFIIIDCETSGLFDFKQPAHAPGQPRLASLAIIQAEDHEDGATLESRSLYVTHEHNFFIRPDGWEMSPEVAAIHGLTTEFLLANGEPLMDALDHYTNLIKEGRVVCAYNSQFDTKVMRGELRRAGLPDLFESTPNICLMRACTNVCRVPKKSGGGFKYPKLSEACAFFKITEEAAHSALGDARSAFAVMQHLHKANLLPTPEVHFAKEKPAALPGLAS